MSYMSVILIVAAATVGTIFTYRIVKGAKMNTKKTILISIILLLSITLFINFRNREFGVNYAKVVDSNGGVHTFNQTSRNDTFGFSVYIKGDDIVVYSWDTKNGGYSRKHVFFNCTSILTY